jgi:hypothetical protein
LATALIKASPTRTQLSAVAEINSLFVGVGDIAAGSRRQRPPIYQQIDGPEKSTEVARRAGASQRAMVFARRWRAGETLSNRI